MKDVIVFGGPNGAGKTTVAQRVVPAHLGLREFVNADEIARGISPFNPEGAAVAAARLLLGRINGLARSGESFAFETTCAGRGHAPIAAKVQGRRLPRDIDLSVATLGSSRVGTGRSTGGSGRTRDRR